MDNPPSPEERQRGGIVKGEACASSRARNGRRDTLATWRARTKRCLRLWRGSQGRPGRCGGDPSSCSSRVPSQPAESRPPGAVRCRCLCPMGRLFVAGDEHPGAFPVRGRSSFRLGGGVGVGACNAPGGRRSVPTPHSAIAAEAGATRHLPRSVSVVTLLRPKGIRPHHRAPLLLGLFFSHQHDSPHSVSAARTSPRYRSPRNPSLREV